MDIDSNIRFVVDASFVLSFLCKEGNTPVEDFFLRFINKEIEFVAPTVLKYEIGNSLKSNILRKRLTKVKAKKLYKYFLDFSIKLIEPDYYQTLELALLKNFSFYDASYYALSKKLGLRLLTLDNYLRNN